MSLVLPTNDILASPAHQQVDRHHHYRGFTDGPGRYHGDPDRESIVLVITRKPGQSVKIGNEHMNIHIRVVKVVGKSVTVGIDAPVEMKILRSELREWDESKRRG